LACSPPGSGSSPTVPAGIVDLWVNDLGGTLTDENISRAAGASHGQLMEEAEFRSIVEPLGRRLEQRTTLYGRTPTAPAPVPG
jgi:2-iminoacetate synthase ThiH